MSTQLEQPARPRPASPSYWMKVAGWALLGLVVALAGTLAYAVIQYQLPGKDLQDLTRFLLISGGVSVVLGALSFRLGLGTRLPSLRIAIAAVYLVGVVVVGVNVLYTAMMMFASPHDLGLLTILLFFSALISLFFAVLLSQSMVSRLRDLLVVARRVASGDLEVRAQDTSPDEIGRLATELNSMVAQLDHATLERERLETSRRTLIASVSHDLRTPLASVRAMVEALNDGVVSDPETVSRYLRTIQNETLHLTTLIDDLFELSQIDAGALQLHVEPTSLSDLLSDALESMSAQAERKQIQIRSHVEGDLPRVPLDAPRMQRVLYNLIQNAIRHTPADGTITLTLRGAPDHVELTVADTGEGIRHTDLPHIFDRFYRGELARTRDSNSTSPGVGLGLAIAKGIVEAHGGSIGATSMPGAGAVFTVVLPATTGVLGSR
ncbi:MAG TPA: ATP-binding protein [Chloroflexia bacterium]